MKVPFFAARNGSWIRSTPAVANGKVFVGGMRDHFLCLDAKTGEMVWEIDFPKKYGTALPDFGFASSPMTDDKHVYVQAGASLNMNSDGYSLYEKRLLTLVTIAIIQCSPGGLFK